MQRKIQFLGLGFEAGQEQPGLRHSPAWMRSFFPVFQEKGIRIRDVGDVLSDSVLCTKIHSSHQIEDYDWRPYQVAFRTAKRLLQEPDLLLNWGGDHSIALSTVAAFSTLFPTGNVVWIDAHADLNLPLYSPTGNFHGMPLSVLLNFQKVRDEFFPWLSSNLQPQNLIYVGGRDFDPFEKRMIRDLNIQVYSSEEIQQRGMKSVAQEIYQKTCHQPLHISFDIDSVSPELAPATGVPVNKGLSLQDIKDLGQIFSRHAHLKSMDVVEINPELSDETGVLKTYLASIQFLMSLLQQSYQGGLYDGTRRSDQEFNTASLESRS